MEPMVLSFTGMIHFPRLKDRLATHFVPFAEFERDAATGALPDFSFIEPNMLSGHGDFHPAMGRSFSALVDVKVDNPSSTLSGEAFLERVFNAYRSATSRGQGRGVLEHSSLDRVRRAPSGAYDHVPPRAGPAAPTLMALPASAVSPSTAPDTGFQPSSSRRGSNRGRSTTRNTGTPP